MMGGAAPSIKDGVNSLEMNTLVCSTVKKQVNTTYQRRKPKEATYPSSDKLSRLWAVKIPKREVQQNRQHIQLSAFQDPDDRKLQHDNHPHKNDSKTAAKAYQDPGNQNLQHDPNKVSKNAYLDPGYRNVQHDNSLCNKGSINLAKGSGDRKRQHDNSLPCRGPKKVTYHDLGLQNSQHHNGLPNKDSKNVVETYQDPGDRNLRPDNTLPNEDSKNIAKTYLDTGGRNLQDDNSLCNKNSENLLKECLDPGGRKYQLDNDLPNKVSHSVLKACPDPCGRKPQPDNDLPDKVSHIDRKTYPDPVDRKLQHDNSLLNKEAKNVAKVSKNYPFSHWRNIVLEQMCDTLGENDAGLVGCIQKAISYHPDIDLADESCNWFDCGMDSCLSQKRRMPGSSGNTVEGHTLVMSNGTPDESNHLSKQCYCAFYDVIISENFGSLCKLLLQNFPGIKIASLFDLSLINSRMKDGVYRCSPMLFSSDIQQVWVNLVKILSDMLSLAKDLSGISGNNFRERVQDLADGKKEVQGLADEKKEFCTPEPDSHAKPEKTGACDAYKHSTCRHCDVTANEKDCLVCDSCEEMYHVSCIAPAVVGIPSRSWYCASCTSKGMGSPHENCVVCERLNSPRRSINEADADFGPETVDHVSDDVDLGKSDDGLEHCRICEDPVKDGEEAKKCSYDYCTSRFFHVGCLTSKQVKIYGDRWYCPSCLCRECLIDRDDDEVILCDACSDGYHTYCIHPPLHSVSRIASWLCKKCDAGVQRILEAKRKYEEVEEKSRKCAEDGMVGSLNSKGKRVCFGNSGSDGTRGVSLLLDAAMALNQEDNCEVF